MNSKLLLILISIITLASCSTAYKTGQTPDDVYYSPARFYDEDNNDDTKKEEDVRKDYAEERQIRMRINDRRWRDFDNDTYYNPYSYGYNYGYYYNPFYYALPVYNSCNCTCITTVNPKNTTPRMANLGGYGNGYTNTNNSTAVNSKTGTYTPTPVRSYNNSNTGSKLGNTLNKIFNNGSGNNSNSSNNSSTQTNRTYTPSSSSSSSSSSGSSSSGSTSRPARSGKGG